MNDVTGWVHLTRGSFKMEDLLGIRGPSFREIQGFAVACVRGVGELSLTDGEYADLRTALSAHFSAQPGTPYQPINKALLEALKVLADAMDPSLSPDPRPLDDLLKFARQATQEAESLADIASKGSKTEVRRDSPVERERAWQEPDWTCGCNYANLAVRKACRNCGAIRPGSRAGCTLTSETSLLQTLRDILAECKAVDPERPLEAMPALDRIETLADDVLAKAEGRNA